MEFADSARTVPRVEGARGQARESRRSAVGEGGLARATTHLYQGDKAGEDEETPVRRGKESDFRVGLPSIVSPSANT